jgi:hypothetical protein
VHSALRAQSLTQYVNNTTQKDRRRRKKKKESKLFVHIGVMFQIFELNLEEICISKGQQCPWVFFYMTKHPIPYMALSTSLRTAYQSALLSANS